MDGDEEMQAVTLIGMYSGMRLNEICSVVGNIREIEGVLCFEVTEGKTTNQRPVSSRFIAALSIWWSPFSTSPITAFFSTVRQSLIRADGKRSTWHTQRLTRAKRQALGEEETERKVFHSLRHEFAQQLDRNQAPEDRIALLMGHERGKNGDLQDLPNTRRHQ